MTFHIRGGTENTVVNYLFLKRMGKEQQEGRES
jgi:hypothetical protein